MKLPFRQGIVKYTLNNDKIPTFLYTDRRDKYVSLIANINHVLITFAHNDTDYLYEETLTTNNAWGPFDRDIKYWMYWDLDVRTGKRTFGSTKLEPIVSETIPETPEHDQHWFNLSDNVVVSFDNELNRNKYRKLSKNSIYVWDGENNHWTQKIRLFAGTYKNTDIVASSLSSQVGIFEQCHAGFILYDDTDSPTQQARVDGTYKFLTSESHFHDTKSLTTTVSLDQIFHYGTSSENISKYSLVSFDGQNSFKTASSDDITLSPAIGIIENDVISGDICAIVTNTYVIDDSWNFTDEPSTPIYLASSGFSTTPPLSGFIQQVGFVVSSNTVYIDTTYQIIYHDVIHTTKAMPVNIDIVTGKLYTSLIDSADSSSSISYDLYSTVYKQPVPNTTWTISHNSHLPNFLVQTYDDRNNYQVPDNIKRISAKIIEVTFSKKTSGTALVFLF
jgi:hypothetical protein